jgi:LysR family glycine cleavage system transcriptional activator
MAQRLPPLNALRAFEAAARRTSFVRAAEELSVTPAAVSQQVRGLEQFLGIQLFLRQRNTLTLTEAGRAFLPGVHEAFRSLTRATEQLQARAFETLLHLSAPPTFATQWLRPRLARFSQRHPDIEVRLAASKGLTDFAREDFDAAIRYGRGPYPGLEAERFLDDELFPVCAPALVERGARLRRPEDLRLHVLLQDGASAEDETAPDWQRWLDRLGVEGIDARKGPAFTPGHLVIHAAIDGQGVALVKRSWVEAELADGRLVRPFGESLPTGFSYQLVRPAGRPVSRKIALFRAWLFEEAGAGRLAMPQAGPACAA